MNLKELAKELNLSISSVSKALRDSHEISEATKQRVLAKAKELNYQVNPFASGLRKQKSKTIALVVPEIANNFFSQAINGIEAVAQQKGYHVLIYLTHEDSKREIEIINILQNGRVDGIIISVTNQTNQVQHLHQLKQNNIPLVLFDRVPQGIAAPKIATNDYKSSYLATQHLIAKGCKRIAFLSFCDNISIIQQRQLGYAEAVGGVENAAIVYCGTDENSNRQLIEELLTGNHPPDGIVASVERLALACYEVCRKHQITIPEQLKIIAYTNLQSAFLLQPALSAITQPAFSMGEEAAFILFRLIEQKGIHLIPDTTVLNSVIELRASTND